MSQNLPVIVAAIVVVFVVFLQIVLVMSRYTKVGPNQVLIISGRKRLLPDGTVVGYRMVKGGGTFVYPIIEKVDVLSLEVLKIIMPTPRARTAEGREIQVDCEAQVKINGDDASIVAAAEYFLSKSPAQIQGIVLPVIEKHLCEVISGSRVESIVQNPAVCAAAIQAACASDAAKMGLSIISITLRNLRTT
jgi:flotillin